MALPVTNLASKLAALAALTGTGGLLNGAKVHLYAAPFAPNPNMQLSDFVEATFVGYAAQSVGTWSAPYVAGDGMCHVGAPSQFYIATDATTPNIIYGAYITNTGGTTLIYAIAFDQPIPMAEASAGLVYEPDFIYGS